MNFSHYTDDYLFKYQSLVEKEIAHAEELLLSSPVKSYIGRLGLLIIILKSNRELKYVTREIVLRGANEVYLEYGGEESSSNE